MSWSAAQYTRFEAERTRPVLDLLARVPDRPAPRAVDLGCGPGNSTQALLARFPDAEATGIDSSADMVRAARERLPGTRFELHDIADWAGRQDGVFDLILANASLQWLPDHRALLPRLLTRLAPGGRLAAQVPDNLDEPSHSLMRSIANQQPWADKLKAATSARATRHDAAWYFGLLTEHGVEVDLWRTTYFHPLKGGAADVVEWLKGTGLRPFLDPLDAAERQAFVQRYQARIAHAYPALPDGAVLLPFPRLFFVAARS